MTEKFDAIVVGAGPAGSTAARELASAGAKVLLLDRHKFPRDKPCGGGITFRADVTSGIDLAPVTEREIHGVRVSVNMGARFDRDSPHLLARMTQRAQLDQYLAVQAACAGADFRDGIPVTSLEIDSSSIVARSNGEVFEARILIGADGVNGPVSKALGLAPAYEHAVAFEANSPADSATLDQWRDRIGLDLAGIPGGYGWVFPRADHLNVGVGGWSYVGPSLRKRLSRLCAFYGFDESKLYGYQGYRLPLRRDGAPVVRGPAMLVGDAAALVDPLSGEGIWASFVSARVAANEATRYLGGEAPDLDGYERRLDAEMREEILASRRLHAVLQRLPSFSVLMLKYNNAFWRYMTEIIRGEITYPDLPKKLGPLRHALYRWGDVEIALHRRKLARAAKTA